MEKLNSKRVCIAILLLISTLAISVLPACAAPAIKVLEPEDGSEVAEGDITVEVEVSDFELVDEVGQTNTENEGHILYYMDAAVPTAPGKPATTAPGTFASTINTSYTWENVSAGTHNFSAQLVNNDQTPLEPAILSQNRVEVTGSGSSLTGSRAENATENLTAENVTVGLAARNIRFNTSTITVPAGAHVTMNFDNQESVPHNFALYENSQAQNAIFKGEVITGPRIIVYTFDAPEEPGTYFFRCDIHPRGMTGQFVTE